MGDAANILTSLDDLEEDADFTLRNLPANNLDEFHLIPTYEEAVTDLVATTKNFSKNVRQLSKKPETDVGASVLQSWKDKLSKLEGDLNVYR